MDSAFIEQMKTKLEEQKTSIIKSLSLQNDDIKEIITQGEQGDEIDVASNVIDSTLINKISGQDKQKLDLIQAALVRIKQGSYGLCLKCKKPIPQPRLEAIPYAFLCVECKTKQEKQK